MAERILGPQGSQRRRRFLWVPMLLVACAALFLIAGAQAVHNTGLFQLDGNADSSVPTGYPAGLEDWNNICKAHLGVAPSTPGALCYSSGGSLPSGSVADKSTFITDAFNAGSDNIYKGGTDDADINTWLWKQAGPSPNKADIENAFAAQYTCTTSGSFTCPQAYSGHKLLFFGGDRYANNGDTNIGLWFFHSPVSTSGLNTNPDGSCTPTSGCGFTGTHTVGNVSLGGTTPGDIFILSAFTGGGAEPTIKVFEWVGPGNATKNYLGSNGCFTSACTLQPLAIPNTQGFSDNRCALATDTSADVACAIVNPAEIDSPWLFQDQSSKSAANKIEANELYEGGLDLTGLGFGEACFSSMLLNTRSSQSGTSVLQDFALGGFGSCQSGILTTPQTGAGLGIGAGGLSISPYPVSVRDHADITVSGVSNFTGAVKFFLCGPLALNSTSNCQTGGVQIGTPLTGEAVSGPSPASVDSDTATLTSAGRYCWRAEFSSSTSGVPPSSDPNNATSTTECFSVNPVQPTLTTQASGNVTLGNAISDSATLNGTVTAPGTNGIGPGGTINATNGVAAGGTIAWTAFGPGNCTTTAMTETTRAVSGDNIYPTAAQAAVSFTPATVGQYTFVASYTGSTPNTLGVAATPCGSQPSNEKVSVGSSSVVTTPSVGAGGTSITTAGSIHVTDSALVTVNGIDTWSGTVAFHLCGPIAAPANCSTGGTAAGTATVNQGSTTGVSDSTEVTSAGRYCWRGDFTSGTAGVPPAHDPSDTTSVTECFVVNPVQPTLSTQASGPATLGDAISDTATLTGTANQPGTPVINPTTAGGAAGGTITWTAFGPDNCTTVAMASTDRTVSGDGTYPTAAQSPVSFTPTAVGTYTFVASYSGNLPNTLGVAAIACLSQPATEKVTVTGHSHLSTAQDWLPNDTATLTGDTTLSGSLTFTLFHGDNCGVTSGLAVTGQSYTVPVPAGTASGSTFSTSNSTFKVTTANAGDYSWLVHYHDNVLTSPADTCEKSTVSITD
jgi:hypothetical protein